MLTRERARRRQRLTIADWLIPRNRLIRMQYMIKNDAAWRVAGAHACVQPGNRKSDSVPEFGDALQCRTEPRGNLAESIRSGMKFICPVTG